MHDLQKAIEIYNKHLEKDSNYARKIVDEWREDMPEEFAEYMFKKEYGCHIVDNVMYDKAVSLFKWAGDKGVGAKWTVEETEKAADNIGIDFDDKDYYALDFAYAMNMFYSDFCDIFTDAGYYTKMARNYLEDADYPGEADERAYKNAKKRVKYFEN